MNTPKQNVGVAVFLILAIALFCYLGDPKPNKSAVSYWQAQETKDGRIYYISPYAEAPMIINGNITCHIYYGKNIVVALPVEDFDGRDLIKVIQGDLNELQLKKL